MSKDKRTPAPASIVDRLPQWLFIAVIIATETVLVFDARDSGILKPYILISGCVALLSLSAFLGFRSRSVEFEWSIAHTLFGAFLIMSAISWLASKSDPLFIADYSRRLACFIVFAYAFHFARKPEARRLAENGLLWMFLAAVAAGTVQGLNMPGLEWIHIEIDRTVVSTFGNATFFSGFLAFTLPFVIARAINAKSPFARSGFILLILWTLYLFVLTEGRTGWIGFLFGVIVFIFLYGGQRRIKLAAAGAILLVVIIAAFSFPDIVQRRFGEIANGHLPTTLQTRLTFWDASWKAIQHSPIIGNGVGNSTLFVPPNRPPDYWIIGAEDIVDHIHNEPLEILAESGIIGFLPWLAFVVVALGTMFRSVMKGKQSSENDSAARTTALGLLAGCVAFFVDSLASMDMRIVGVACVFWYALGTALGSGTIPTRRIKVALPQHAQRFAWAWAVPLAVFLYFYIPMASSIVQSRKVYYDATAEAKRDPRMAAALFRQSIELDSNFSDARYYYCYNLMRTKAFEEAKHQLEFLISKDPTYPKSHLLLAIAHSELGDSLTARREAQKELAIASYSSSFHYAAIIARRAQDTATEYQYLSTGVSNAVKAGTSEFVAVDLGRLPDIAGTDSSRRQTIRALASKTQIRFSDDTLIAQVASDVLKRLRPGS